MNKVLCQCRTGARTEAGTSYRLIKINDDISEPSNFNHRDKLTFAVPLLFCLHYIYSTLVIHDLTWPRALLQSPFACPRETRSSSAPVILISLLLRDL